MILIFAACSKNEDNEQSRSVNGCDKVATSQVVNIASLDQPAISVLEAEYSEGCLNINVQYGGGCEEHVINLSLIPAPSLPASADVFEAFVLHESTDQCEALITETVSFDISQIYDGQRDASIMFNGSDVVVEIKG